MPTPRQLEVLRLMASGMTQEQIAEAMVLAVQSVKNHKSEAYRRLGVANMTQAYLRLGWLQVPE